MRVVRVFVSICTPGGGASVPARRARPFGSPRLAQPAEPPMTSLSRVTAAGLRATFGCYRFSLTQLAARLASPLLAAESLAPATALGVEAVTARAVFDAERDGVLDYLLSGRQRSRVPRARCLARTLEELGLAEIGMLGCPPRARSTSLT